MNVIDLNKYKEKLTFRKRLIIGIILLIIILIIAFLIVYLKNESFREWTDNYILKKNIENEDTTYINIDLADNPNIYAYDKYITILSKNNLYEYNVNGIKVYDMEVNISNPLYAKNGKYLCIGEKEGTGIYLISGSNIVWQGNTEGKIQKICVNKNGYISVVETGTSYKNIIVTYNSDGKQLFKTYLSSTTAISVDISDDNEHLAIAEIDTSGAIIKSNVKIISISKAQTEAGNSIEKTISAEQGNILTDIKYQERNILVCIYDNGIHIIENGEDKKIVEFEAKTYMADIKNKNNIVYVKESSNGLFNSSEKVMIKNIINNNEVQYDVEGTVKSLQVYDGNIVINLGTEAQFINTNGWLQKKYNSKQEIPEIVLGTSIAGILYRDRIEIINL